MAVDRTAPFPLCALAGHERGCKFEPRYDEGSATFTNEMAKAIIDSSTHTEADKILDAVRETRSRTYVHDVCETCGTVVRRAP